MSADSGGSGQYPLWLIHVLFLWTVYQLHSVQSALVTMISHRDPLLFLISFVLPFWLPNALKVSVLKTGVAIAIYFTPKDTLVICQKWLLSEDLFHLFMKRYCELGTTYKHGMHDSAWMTVMYADGLRVSCTSNSSVSLPLRLIWVPELSVNRASRWCPLLSLVLQICSWMIVWALKSVKSAPLKYDNHLQQVH